MREARELLARIRELRRTDAPAVVATIVAVEGSAYRREGTRLLIEPDGALTGVLSGGCVERELLAPARETLAAGRPRSLRFDLSADEEAIWGFGLGCSGTLTLLLEPLASAGEPLERALAAAIEDRRAVRLTTRVGTATATDPLAVGPVDRRIELLDSGRASTTTSTLTAESESANEIVLVETWMPPVRLVVVGAERDVVPLARLAAELGWDTTVVDSRPTAAAEARVATLARYLGCAPRRLLESLSLDSRTAVVVATHRYLDDLAFLGELAAAEVGYLGLLGPARRRERLLADLASQRGSTTHAPAISVRGPAGLDLGGRTPEEVALAIVAEIQATLHGGTGRPLAEKEPASTLEPVEPRP